MERIAREEGLTVLGWRDTPVEVRRNRPHGARIAALHRADLHWRRVRNGSQDDLERKLYVVRKRAEAEIAATDLRDKGFFYIPSLSSRTIVYKGLLLAPQIAEFYRELADPDAISALCLVHQRFSTNTFPIVATRASVSLSVPQRRNQYRSRQRELDERARDRCLNPTLFGDGSEEAFSDNRSRWQRFLVHLIMPSRC